MWEPASHPATVAQIKIDPKVQDIKLNLEVSSDRPSIVELPQSHPEVETLPENELSKELPEKPLPISPTAPPLLILDLNGCILYREYFPGSARVIKPRPYLDDLFEYIFAPNPKNNNLPNWELMIWSSAQPQNVELMLKALKITKRPPPQTTRRGRRGPKNPLSDISNRLVSLSIEKATPGSDKKTQPPVQRTVIDVWDRSTLDLSSEDYGRNVSTTKDLRKAWDQFSWTDPTTGEKLKWGSHNTVIVDDTPRKLTLQPDNLCLVDEFKGDPEDKEILRLIEQLKSLRDESNVAETLKKLKEKEQASAV